VQGAVGYWGEETEPHSELCGSAQYAKEEDLGTKTAQIYKRKRNAWESWGGAGHQGSRENGESSDGIERHITGVNEKESPGADQK